MQTKITLCLALLFVWLSSGNAITVDPKKNVTEGNCSGPLEYILCNCTTLGTTIDIHLLPGQHEFTLNQSCFLKAIDSIKIVGNSSNDTIIECKEPFNILFMGVRSVTISNIMMVNCGNVANDSINQIVHNITNNSGHFGSGFRFAIMFYQVKNIILTDFIMKHTLGYGIFSFTAEGNITFYEVRIENTTFENDPRCQNYDYNNDNADFTCSGSGIFVVYYDNGYSVNKTNILTIDQSHFIGNNNFLPNKQLGILDDIANIGFSRASIPVVGAAGITIFYLQNMSDVNAAITNSNFCNNNGALSASIAIGSFSTTRGKTFIQGCSFDDNNRIRTFSDISSDNGYFSGGISYLSLIKKTGIHSKPSNRIDSSMSETLTVKQCNFTKLGGRLGAAFHIEKISVDATPLLINIEQCDFTENEANMGSAVYAVDRKLDATLSNYNCLTISLVNVNANNNKLLPGITLEFVSSTFITGLFHSENCHFKFYCKMQCDFSYNQPSVFYGSSAFVTISGEATFSNNTSLFGGGLNLINTVAFIHENSRLHFVNNHAISNGGAIRVFFLNTNTQSRDRCPIQFTGPSNATPVYNLNETDSITVEVMFENNTAGQLSKKSQSIHANVFYVCNWYSNSLTQIYLRNKKNTSLRSSVYGKILSFVPDNSISKHLSILAYLPCPCNENKTFNAEYCLTADHNNVMQLGTNVIVGRSFTISLITLDAVGSVGHSSYLYSKVSSLNLNASLELPNEQITRSFSLVNNTCTPINFTIYSSHPITYPANGTLHLSFPRSADHNLHFSFDPCPAGFSLQKTHVDNRELYACSCGGFFNKSPVNKDFQCDSVSGKIRRIDVQSWLSVINNNTVEYTRLCLPEQCNNDKFITTDPDVLCNPHHTGRACAACHDGFSKKFGSKHCQKCSNFWLFTIILYGILGIILVLVIHLLKLTVTMGTINGLIFFCNIMSINENLFFDTSKFSSVRLFVSLINLDLGFEMCFYKEMSELAKTGLQFVFPLYLWLLIFIIIMVGKHYIRRGKSTHSAVPVLATLILLSYSKLLRTTINVFTSVTVYHSETESDFNKQEHLLAWQLDPNVQYLSGAHILLFLVALAFTVFFILPLAFALTFPSIVLRSKRMSYFFPLLDCIYAPYKLHCRSWFGMRIIVLIYFSVMEGILFSYQDSLLLSGVIVILLFVLMQAYIHPFKNTINNMLDLMFMVVFIALSIVVLYLYPDTLGHKKFIAISIFGGIAFLLFCFIIVIHLHDALMHFTQYSKFTETLQAKFHMKKSNKDWNLMCFISTENVNHKPEQMLSENINESFSNYAYLQESLLEEQFN